ncbi:MAG: DUF2442 domain-containing protein [Gemmatimonadota bacterium]|nr:DUF2442 domain-containing protein [Gemmatimonadota bacterium]
MKSVRPGTPTSGVEVTNVSPHGFWLLLDDREIFLSFEHFPWFADATIRDIGRVERPSPHHLYWPNFDVDLAVESLERPEAYPLVSGTRPHPESKPAGRRRGGPVPRK